ncbi:hypothetical protein [Streptomyces sp. NPDC094032]|uniref:hypothetical protein n=1 Tax=Streptomyces sp. NPDC094032 TaxID=3155308 RepID=UPI0033201D49
MAVLGQVRETYWRECSPARMVFAEKFRALIGVMESKKQGARAGLLGVAPSTLSNYWIGRRMPRADKLRVIYQAVASQAARPVLPVTLAELEEARAAALAGDHDLMAVQVITAVPVQERGGSVPAQGPALDRRNGQNGKVGETVDVLREARRSGSLRHLVGAAWSASRTLTLVEFCDVVGALHGAGDADLTEALLLADGERAAEESMRLALALMDAGLTGSARLVMKASVPAGGGVTG